MKKRTKKAIISRRTSPRKTPLQDKRHSPRPFKFSPKIMDDDEEGPPPDQKPSAPLPPKRTIKLTISENKDDQPVSKASPQSFGDKLSDEQADISLTIPLGKDKKRFQAALQEVFENYADLSSL